jgi:diguanylate cyclase (GGDEF)-like protein/PAS domain S-box-containing protein
MQGTSLATHFTVSDGEDFSALSVERTEVRAVSRPKVGDAVDVVLTFSGTIVADPSLRLLFVQAVDQRALSNASKSARDQLQTFFHDSRDITYVLDQRGRLVDVNEFGAKQLGYSRDELISGQHSVQIHEADRRTVNDRYTQVLRGEAHRFEARFIRRNGSVMLASILARPNFQNGEVTGLIGDARDITKQRAAQTQLQEGEQRYRALFVDHVDAVLTTDREGNFLHANPAFERMIGRKAETLQGTDYLPLIVPELREYTSRQYDQAVEGHTVEYETRIAGSAHNEIDLYVTLIPVIINDAVEEIHCIAKDVTAFRKAQRDLERMAFTHRVTGLPNRNALEQHLTSLVQLGDMFSVLNLDLDRFKTVNDRYGRKVGDDILRAVAERLCGFITAPTRLFQYSGDNFVIVHQHARDEEAFEFASKIEHLIRGPFAIDGQEIIISVSIGVCVFPEYGFDPESLMRRSEDAMLEAKKRGRSHVAFFRELNSDDGARLLKLEFGLQHALENEDLTIVYQPQVNVQTGDIHGVEALLRWTDPELGTISPAEFIPVAERNGTIHDIGMWVIEEACRQLKSWENLDSHHFRLAVNASIVQFYDSFKRDRSRIAGDRSDRIYCRERRRRCHAIA